MSSLRERLPPVADIAQRCPRSPYYQRRPSCERLKADEETRCQPERFDARRRRPAVAAVTCYRRRMMPPPVDAATRAAQCRPRHIPPTSPAHQQLAPELASLTISPPHCRRRAACRRRRRAAVFCAMLSYRRTARTGSATQHAPSAQHDLRAAATYARGAAMPCRFSSCCRSSGKTLVAATVNRRQSMPRVRDNARRATGCA